MKIKGMLLAAISLLGVSSVWAQGVEYDDMYFNAEDRAKLNAKRATEVAYNTSEKYNESELESDDTGNMNPTESYSARNVNPEYTSRVHTQAAQADNQDYFVDNYQYKSNQFNNWNNNYNQWNNSSWYRSNYYGPGINTWNSPYYGYDSWSSPWYDPYWAHNGWSSSFSFHYGNSWNYGWGGNYNYWNRPYYGYDSFYGHPYYGGNSFYGGMGMYAGYWNNYRYPRTIVVVNNGESGGRKVVYGKRPTRGTSVVSDRNSSRSRTNVTPSREDNSSGRSISTQSRKQADYYNRYNNTQRSSNNTSTFDSRTNTQNNRSRSWGDTYDSNSSGRSSTPSYSPSRSTSSGGATRSTGSGSNGRTRGSD